MSIETVGPQKYAFQDLVCVAILLQLHNKNNISFFVEPSNGEDARITLTDSTPIKEIDIQVKGAKGDVTLANIAEYLAHFPHSQAENCLFDRLVSNPSLIVVFVMSGRCNDGASCYLSKLNWPFNPHERLKIKMNDARDLLKEFPLVLSPNSKSSSLEVERYNYLKKINAANYRVQSVRQALERLIIVEKIDEDFLMIKCGELLSRRYSIPDDRHQAAIERMKSVVFAGKDTKKNILPEFFPELISFMPSPLRPVGYISHGLEEVWIKTLSEKSVLLMSGSPRVGKTTAARWVAAEFSAKGYDVKETGDAEEAYRFIIDPSLAKRLVLMDDPFGDAHPTQNASHALTRIESFIKRLGVNRKLIIAQVQDRLLEVTSKSVIAEIKTVGHPWLDMSKPSSTFLSNLWSQLQIDHEISEPLASIVLEALSKGELKLEAGCLEYLAIHHQNIDDPTDLGKIVRLAHENASSLARALKSENYKPFLLGLAATTNHNQSIAITDLAYVLGSGGGERLAISSISAIACTMGVSSHAPKTKLIKEYETTPETDRVTDSVIESLEQRRMIEWKLGNSLMFAHSFYRSAAEFLFQDGTRQSEEEIITILDRGVFCLSPHTSRATARNLNWIYHSLKQEHFKVKLVEIAIDALDSSYPSTRDIAFGFLVRNLSAMPSEIHQDLPSWVSRVSWLSLNNVEWVEGEPIFPMGEKITIEADPLLDLEKIKYNEYLNLFAKKDASFVQPKDAWELVRMLGHHPERMDENIISRLLGYDEALIRAQAIWVWLKHPREKDSDILDQIFTESHPAIAQMILKGIREVWSLTNSERKTSLLQGLKKVACLSTTACVLIDTLVKYGRENFEQDKSPWEVFEVALPIVLDALPVSAKINDARLFDVIQKAKTKLSTESILVVIDSWIGYVERIAKIKTPSDFMLGVTSILIEVTKGLKETRMQRVKKLLELNGTGSVMRVISDLVDDWQHLMDFEKDLIIGKLNESRIDSNWLRAVVLVRDEVPIELETEILPKGIRLKDQSIDQLYIQNPQLFLAAIQIYCGHPQPLWWIGTHHRGEKVWKFLVEKIACDALHPLFKMAWEEISMKGEGDYVANFVRAVGSAHAEQVFDILLSIKVKTTGYFMPEAWSALFELVSDRTIRSKWIKAMASHAFSVLDDLAEFLEWLPDNSLFEEFLGHFPNDKQLLTLSHTMCGAFDKIKGNHTGINSVELLDSDGFGENIPEMQVMIIGLLHKTFVHLPPLHHGTCDTFRNRVRKIDEFSKILPEIDQYRKSLFDKEKNVYRSLEQEEKVNDWIW